MLFDQQACEKLSAKHFEHAAPPWVYQGQHIEESLLRGHFVS
jgi:hypothetical protein